MRLTSLALQFRCFVYPQFAAEMGNGKWEMGNGKWEMGNGYRPSYLDNRISYYLKIPLHFFAKSSWLINL